MLVEVFASSEDKVKFLGGRFGDIEDMRLPGEIYGDGDTANINRGQLELRAGQYGWLC